MLAIVRLPIPILCLLCLLNVSHAQSLSMVPGLQPTQVWSYAQRITLAPSATLQEAMNSGQWQSTQGLTPSVGFTKQAEWLKFRVTNEQRSWQTIRYFWHHAQIDSATIYTVAPSGYVTTVALSTLTPIDERPIPSRMLEWQQTLAPESYLDVYIRAESPLAISFRIKAGAAEQIEVVSRHNEAWAFLYFGFMIALLIYNLSLGINIGEKGYFYYSLYVGLVSVYVMNLLGFGFAWGFYDDTTNQLRVTLGLAWGWVIAALLFSHNFLSLKTISPILQKISYGLISITTVAFAFTLIPSIDLFIQVAPLLTLVNMLFIIFSSALALKHKKKYALYFLLGWLCMLSGLLVHEISILFGIKSEWLSQEAIKLATAFEAVFLSWSLGTRITELRARNRQLNDEKNVALRRANDELTLRLTQQKESAKQKDAILNLISHELKTPLNVIQSSIELEALKPQVYENQEDLTDASERMRRHIDNLVVLAEISTERVVLNEQTVQMSQLLQQLRDFADFRISSEQSFTIVQDGPLEEHLFFDAIKVSLLLQNLLDNAFKFSKSGLIELQICQKEHQLHWQVKDSGEGIDAGLQQKIYDLFQQSDMTKARKYEGLGIGMTVVSEISRLLSARLSIESSPGSTVVSFSHSVASVNAEHPNKAPLTNALVVDDNLVNLKIMGKLFEALGFSVTTVSNGTAALDAIESNDFSTVFMDLQMPEMDGFETCERLRAAGYKGKMFAVSANDTSQDRKRAEAVGMDGFIAKPLRLTTIKHALKPHFQDL